MRRRTWTPGGYPAAVTERGIFVLEPGHEALAQRFWELMVDGADLPAFLEALKIFSHAVSLGGIESLVVRPALMVQAAYTQAHRDEYGVSDNLIRLAIGIEEIEDIIEDLERGLTAALAH